jgi:hypothetical protein
LNAKDYTGKWVVLFFYPKDFTFVCPTEIIAYSDRVKEFRSRNAEVIGASCDSAEVCCLSLLLGSFWAGHWLAMWTPACSALDLNRMG